MNWTDFMIAIKQGLIPSAESVRQIQTVSGGTLKTYGWYRVAEFSSPSAGGIKGSYANSVMLFIKRNHQNNLNEQHLLLCESLSDGSQSFATISSKSRKHLISKARYTYDPTDLKAYLEIYYSGGHEVGNYCSFEVSHTGNGVGICWQAIEPALTDETVEGVTVTTTYDIPANATPLTTANKPTGTYTGNGSSTTRTVSIGGIGDVCIITCDAPNTVSIVTRQGAIVKAGSGTSVTGLAASNVNFKDGVLTIASTSSHVNQSGYEYTYQVV